MLDTLDRPELVRAVVMEFAANSVASGSAWHCIPRPRGVSMLSLFLLAGGGNGGLGTAGANSTAAGGGGGGSSGQTTVTIPAHLLPDTLYASIGYQGVASRISIYPDLTANHCLATANAGGNGGNAAGAVAGTAGTAGAVAAITAMPIAGMGQFNLLAGQAGALGGGTANGNNVALPTTGLMVMGGASGAGLGAAAANGSQGGNVTAAGIFPSQLGGTATAVATTPGGDGSNGYDRVLKNLNMSYPGTGGGSTHGSATGAGLLSGKGGNGGRGCGGGGSGGGLTGSTIGPGGIGGAGYALLVWW